MIAMVNSEYSGRYKQLFENADKAALFDKIAEQFYAGNFGRMTKSDFETLMFSIYIEQILKNGDKNFSAYSDYKLAKELGITQSKVSSLKVRKQLQYPYEYDWRESLASVSNRARYESGKIKIQIPDINLYYDIKNAIEEKGGFIDVSLTRSLLVVSPEYFLDLLDAISDECDREQLRKCIRDEYRKHGQDKNYIEEEPIGKQLKKFGADLAVSIISGFVGGITGQNPLTAAGVIAKNVLGTINQSK